MTGLNEVLGGALPGLGFGAAVGFVVGFTAKKISKVLAFALGGLVILMVIFQSVGWVTINWGAVEESTKPLLGDGSGVTIADQAWEVLVANIPFGSGFAGGFAIGFKVG
jgi:uncharacterized membrane protein (Fun14 family)